MPFGQSKNVVIYSPVRAEYLAGGNACPVKHAPYFTGVAGWQNNYLSALVRICRAKRAAKEIICKHPVSAHIFLDIGTGLLFNLYIMKEFTPFFGFYFYFRNSHPGNNLL